MNNIGEFFVTFTTTGIKELKDGLKDINERLDALNKSFSSGATKGDSFFSKFTSWGLKLTALASGFIGVGNAIKDAFNMGNEIIQLNLAADVAGTTAENVEALSIAMYSLTGNRKDVSSAANFYRNMAETQTQWWRGQYSDEVIKQMSYAGVRNLTANATEQQWMNGLIDTLHFYQNQHTKQAIGARNLFAKAFGLTDAQMAFFATGRDFVHNQLDYGMQHLTLSGEGNLEKAIEQSKAKLEFETNWQNLVKELIPLTTQIYEVLSDIVIAINDFFNSDTWVWIKNTAKWFYDTFRQGWEDIKQWFDETFNVNKYGENEPTVENASWQVSEHQGRMALKNILNNEASIKDITILQKRLSEAGTLNPELKQAFGNEMNKLMSLNAMEKGLPLNLKYDENLKLADVLLKYGQNPLNTRSTSVTDSHNTSNSTVNANINVYGQNAPEQVGNQIKGYVLNSATM